MTEIIAFLTDYQSIIQAVTGIVIAIFTVVSAIIAVQNIKIIKWQTGVTATPYVGFDHNITIENPKSKPNDDDAQTDILNIAVTVLNVGSTPVRLVTCFNQQKDQLRTTPVAIMMPGSQIVSNQILILGSKINPSKFKGDYTMQLYYSPLNKPNTIYSQKRIIKFEFSKWTLLSDVYVKIEKSEKKRIKKLLSGQS